MPPKADRVEELNQLLAVTREKIEVAEKGNVVIKKNADGEYRDDDDDDVNKETGPWPTRTGIETATFAVMIYERFHHIILIRSQFRLPNPSFKQHLLFFINNNGYSL
ncbi:hypothetical protein SLEP1_g55363 [Rubroshorea leprosula]|uniref:Uncharacterized protein n=1 Tax=Rubroshorea leprosula TaxID=152421 RepID=A0AAV5MHP8_9ROSI|nr:hypothetical protein SLEP1_g55363 [Rubroshorea leprosula]